MPRVKLFDQKEALNIAMELFWEKGYASTSLSDLTNNIGISKGSFYDTFTSKRNIFEKAFGLYRHANIELLKKALNSEPNVKKGIRKLCDLLIDQALADPKHKGCFVANTCSELGGRDEQISNLLNDHYNLMHQTIVNYVSTGNFKDLEVDIFASTLISYLTGINQELKYRNDKKRYMKSTELILTLLN